MNPRFLAILAEIQALRLAAQVALCLAVILFAGAVAIAGADNWRAVNAAHARV